MMENQLQTAPDTNLWLAPAEVFQYIGSNIFYTALIILVAWLFSVAIQAIVKNSLRKWIGKTLPFKKRVETIVYLVQSLIKYSIYITALFIILANVWQVNTGSILVGTAVLGTAIGFGSQGLVQDVINGLSLLLENQMNVGDYVEAAGKTGVVKDVGLRTVRIVGFDGMEHVIFTRQITNVSSWPQGKLDLQIEMRLQNKDQLPAAEQKATQALEMLSRTDPRILKAPKKILEYALSERTHILRWHCPVTPLQAAEIRQSIAETLIALASQEQLELADPPVKTTLVLQNL